MSDKIKDARSREELIEALEPVLESLLRQKTRGQRLYGYFLFFFSLSGWVVATWLFFALQPLCATGMVFPDWHSEHLRVPVPENRSHE